MTLGGAARLHAVLRVWCPDCLHQVDLDPAEQAELHGADMEVPDWASRLVCSRCGSRNTISSARLTVRADLEANPHERAIPGFRLLPAACGMLRLVGTSMPAAPICELGQDKGALTRSSAPLYPRF